MPRIPLEDNFTDVIGKAQRGRRIDDDALAKRAGVSPADLAAAKAGRAVDAILRQLARPLGLNPNALEELAHNRWYPEQADFPRGFAMFNTPYDDITVNSYLVWDARTRDAAAFDTGANCDAALECIQNEGLRVASIFVTHSHEDHIADLARLARATGAEVWSSEREPVRHPGARAFREGDRFSIGGITLKTLLTWGHSPGQTTFFVTGLSWPLAVVGDSLFAASIGGSASHFEDQYRNDVEKIFSLPRDTVLACGHGPLTTVAQERLHNPFFAT